jgi:hypothetical protein
VAMGECGAFIISSAMRRRCSFHALHEAACS